MAGSGTMIPGIQYTDSQRGYKMITLIKAVMLIGVITTYAGKYIGEPLYCDRGNGLTYRDDIAFVALDVREYQSGRVQCGDWLRVTVNGASFWAQALDAGPFEPYRVTQFGDVPIVGDVPFHLWAHAPDISGRGGIFNESRFNRLSRDAKMGHLAERDLRYGTETD